MTITKRFVWKDEYSVGVQIIDEQHRIFFKLTNDVLDFLSQPEISQDREVLINLLNDLGNYALYHFSTEEEYFDQFHYQDAVPHTEVHDHFRATIKKLFYDAMQENADINQLAGAAAEYTGNWLVKHIIIMDKAFTGVFHEHGLK